MIFFNNFKQTFSNIYNFEKLYNILKHIIKNFKNNLSSKSLENVFFINVFKLRSQLCGSFKNTLNKIENNLNIIDKTFEGSAQTPSYKPFYNNVGVVNFLKYNKAHSYMSKQSLYESSKEKITNNILFYRLGSIVSPLTSQDNSGVNNYVYNIYKHIYQKSKNSYKSCVISLFNYYIGTLFSLTSMYRENDIDILNSNLFVIVSKISSFVIALDSFYSDLSISFILPVQFIAIINNSLHLSGIKICCYRPFLIGLTRYILSSTGIFSKLSFQDTLKTLKTIVLENKTDWNVDSKSSVITSGFMPAGSGWYRYFSN